MKPKPSQVPINQTFEEVQRLIFLLVNRFLVIYKVDKDELLSAAYLGFVQAYHSWKSNMKMEFTSWLWLKIEKRMLDVLRKDIKDRKHRPLSLDLSSFDVPQFEPKFDFDPDEWMSTLSRDARKVAKLAIRSPIDIVLIRKQLKEDSPGNYRQAIRQFLFEIGWDITRIKQSFREIQESL